jgi:phage tail-like protein
MRERFEKRPDARVTMDEQRERNDRMIDLLPAIYQDPGGDGRATYLHRFLAAFEEIVYGTRGSGKSKQQSDAPLGLREEIERLGLLLDPWQAPAEFLPWLAGWMALSLRSNLRPERQRELVANIAQLYRIRGTRRYLEELLRLCVDVPTAIEEEDVPALQIGDHSTVGRDMYLGGGAPHFFRVRMFASGLSVPELEEQRQLVYEVVELARPAHTAYEFRIDSPEMQVGVHSTVGIDTVLGSAQAI